MVLQKNQVNEIVIEVSERATLSNPFYLFEFVNKHTKQRVFCICVNESESIERYDLFNIEDKADPDPEAGEVNLASGTQYHVKIYEQPSDSNIDPEEEGVTLLKEDVWSVANNTAEPVAYNGASTTNVAYGG